MSGNSPYVFRNTELDSHLLSSPFSIQTNWHVITGAPSCGKTTLINLLAARGFKTVPECARKFMEGEIAAGRTVEEIRKDLPGFQQTLLSKQLRVESQLEARDFIFLDGAVPGFLGWFRVFGLDPNEILQACFRHRYASVFILDKLPLQPDGLRFKDDAFFDFLDRWMELDYLTLGYKIIRIPVMPPEERLALVLTSLARQGVG